MEWELAEKDTKVWDALDRALSDGAQRIDRPGKGQVVVVSAVEYERLVGQRRTIKSMLTEGPSFEGLDIERSADSERGPVPLRYLVDTCVISEIRHPMGNERVKAAFENIDSDDLYLSVLVVGEIWKGIRQLPQGAKRKDLENWIVELITCFGDRIVVVDLETSEIWGRLSADSRLRGRTIPAIDGLIAATALRHGFALVTRNLDHFADSGAQVIDPWQDN